MKYLTQILHDINQMSLSASLTLANTIFFYCLCTLVKISLYRDEEPSFPIPQEIPLLPENLKGRIITEESKAPDSWKAKLRKFAFPIRQPQIKNYQEAR